MQYYLGLMNSSRVFVTLFCIFCKWAKNISWSQKKNESKTWVFRFPRARLLFEDRLKMTSWVTFSRMVIVYINTEKYVWLCGAALEDAYLAFVRHPRRVRSASRALSSAAAATVVLLDGEQIQFLSLNSVVHSESVHLKPIENVRTNNRKFGRNFSIGR